MCHNFYHYPRARRKAKWRRQVLVGIVRLDLNASCVQNGFTLSLGLAPCFLLPIMIKGGKSTTMRTQTVLDSRASSCFIDKELVWHHNVALVEKATLVAIEMIDDRNLFSRHVMYETKVLMVTIGSHSSKIVFNVISFPTNLIIIGLSCLILHNP